MKTAPGVERRGEADVAGYHSEVRSAIFNEVRSNASGDRRKRGRGAGETRPIGSWKGTLLSVTRRGQQSAQPGAEGVS